MRWQVLVFFMTFIINHTFIGSRKDDSDDLTRRFPHREQEATRTLPRHRTIVNNDQLVGRVCEMGSSDQGHLIQGQSGPKENLAG
jgi:hypothetical protein